MKHYKVRFPGDYYAADFCANSKKAVKDQVRRYLGKDRLLRGIEIWEFSPTSKRIVEESMRSMANDYHRAGQIADF